VERFYRVKSEVRVIGFDDSPFRRGDSEVLVVGCVFRGGKSMDGLLSFKVSVDGLDATERLIASLSNMRFRDVRVVMLDGIAFGGFNVVDIKRIYNETGYPVIAVTRRMPDFEEIKSALTHTSDAKKRWDMMACAGEPFFVKTKGEKGVYVQCAGLNSHDASEIASVCATRSLLPEPIRCAHIIASGMVFGESRGKA
jgi:uncharacterized protein